MKFIIFGYEVTLLDIKLLETMPTLLKPNEYDASYFDGKYQAMRHNAGYSTYGRWRRVSADFVPHEESTGEFYRDMALKLKNDYQLAGKKVLDIGCAKGFIVEDLRSMGVDAYGIDISTYAIGQAAEAVKPYLTVADLRTHLSTYQAKEFDFVFSRWTLECLSDAEITEVVKQLNSIAKTQLHIEREDCRGDYYNAKTVREWADNFQWNRGTMFIPNGNMQQKITK